jgi:hypothetical protein
VDDWGLGRRKGDQGENKTLPDFSGAGEEIPVKPPSGVGVDKIWKSNILQSMARNTPTARYFNISSRARLGTNESRLVSFWAPEELMQRLAYEVGNEVGLSQSDTIRVVLEEGLSARKGRKKGTRL